MTTEQFELRKARRWPWLAALAVIILLAIAFWWWRGHTQSQQVVFGSTLKIHYEPAMAGEQRIIEYINQHIAPDYGLKLEAVGVQDPVQADRAVAEGQYAGTIYQHQFVFKELDLLTMPRALNSVDAAIGYVSQFDAGKVPREKGILFPPAPRTFASQLVIGTPYLSQENIVKLKQAFSDPRIQTWLKTTDDPLVKDVLVPVSAE
ncbi:TPA: hypothetical protein PIN69_002267 [Klebsiella pneumoniae]|nr:hypothetical protein [Klebsiella pneumoniae]